MSLVAIIPVASLIAANAALHSWDDSAFLAALKLLPNVVVDDGTRAEGQRAA